MCVPGTPVKQSFHTHRKIDPPTAGPFRHVPKGSLHGGSRTDHLQRMAAEFERAEQSRLQQHCMRLDGQANQNGRRRLDSVLRAKEVRRSTPGPLYNNP